MKARPGLDPSIAPHEVVGEKVYSVAEVANLMRVTAPTVRNWITSGRIKAIKRPGGYVILQSELTRMATTNF